HEGELRIRACDAQDAGRNHNAIVGHERIKARVDLKMDRYGAGNHRNDRMRLVDAVAPDQDLDGLLAIVTHVPTDPCGSAVPWNRFIIESQELIAAPDIRDRRW